ncbi:MAG: YncE family protein [Clostridiaceae bacterium]
MKNLFISNTSRSSIEVINLDTFSKIASINLNDSNNSNGPHNLCIYNDKIITANNYSNGISMIDRKLLVKIEDIYIGAHCNDVKTFKNYAYVACGDNNNVAVFDLEKSNLVELLPCGNNPHNIDILKTKGLLLISNFDENTITLVNLNNKTEIMNIKVGPNPTKAIFSYDGNYAYICESNIYGNGEGSLSIISLKNLNVINRIGIGKTPIDFHYDGNYCYISCFGEGVIKILDLSNNKVIKKINIGGIPKSIIRSKENIYYCDYLSSSIIRTGIAKEDKKAITLGGELNGMIIA